MRLINSVIIFIYIFILTFSIYVYIYHWFARNSDPNTCQLELQKISIVTGLNFDYLQYIDTLSTYMIRKAIKMLQSDIWYVCIINLHNLLASGQFKHLS